MKPFIPFLTNVVVALLLIAAASRRSFNSPRWAILGVLPLVSAGMLATYVFSEDTYRDNGTSRWEAYRSPGGSLGTLFVVSIVSLALCAALLVYSGLGGQPRLFRWTAFGASICCLVLITATTMGFSLN